MFCRAVHTSETTVDTHVDLFTGEIVEVVQKDVAGQCLPPTAQIQTTAVPGHLMPDLLIGCSTREVNQVPSTKHTEVCTVSLITFMCMHTCELFVLD
jgi:hypothetical protein